MCQLEIRTWNIEPSNLYYHPSATYCRLRKGEKEHRLGKRNIGARNFEVENVVHINDDVD